MSRPVPAPWWVEDVATAAHCSVHTFANKTCGPHHLASPGAQLTSHVEVMLPGPKRV